ncbi:hypothetical protein CsSME_00012065 [Camellia sinensis var. sinensis]
MIGNIHNMLTIPILEIKFEGSSLCLFVCFFFFLNLQWPRKLFRQPFVEQCCWTSPAFVNSCALSWMRSLRSSTLLDLETTPQRRELLGDWMQWFSPGLDAVVFLRIVVFSYFGSTGVSGAIPSTFAALRNLQTVWASDNELTGSIPEFIGNWSKLKSLETPLEVQYPTFSNLTLMEDLRISDLSNGSSSLAFLKDMKSLNLLILRNNNISGSIPSNIGDNLRLLQLDFSFNKLTGQIPDSLFNLSSLTCGRIKVCV